MALDVAHADLLARWLAAPADGKHAARNVLDTLFPPGGGLGRVLFPMNVLAT
jgi:hypothetical protein